MTGRGQFIEPNLRPETVLPKKGFVSEMRSKVTRTRRP